MEKKSVDGKDVLHMLHPGLVLLKIISVENVRSVRKSLYILRVIDMKGGYGFITIYTDHEYELYMELSDEIFYNLLSWSDSSNITYTGLEDVEFMAYNYHYEVDGDTFCSIRPMKRGEPLMGLEHKPVNVEFESVNRRLLKKMYWLGRISNSV